MTETTTQRSMYAIIKIDVTKINKEWLFHGKNGKKFLDVIVKDAKNSQYGDDYMAVQAVPKAEREKGTKYGPILGGGKNLGEGSTPRPKQQSFPVHRQTQAPGSPVIHESPIHDDVPF